MAQWQDILARSFAVLMLCSIVGLFHVQVNGTLLIFILSIDFHIACNLFTFMQKNSFFMKKSLSCHINRNSYNKNLRYQFLRYTSC